MPLIVSLMAEARDVKINVTVNTGRPTVFALYQSALQIPLAWPRVRKAVTSRR